MSAYAEDRLESGAVVHTLHKDGLRLESQYSRNDGAGATLAVEWADLDTARDNYENARQAALKRIEDLPIQERMDALQATGAGSTNQSWLRTLAKTETHKLELFINGGPPIWKLPRVSVIRKPYPSLRFGWLYRAYQVSWVRR